MNRKVKQNLHIVVKVQQKQDQKVSFQQKNNSLMSVSTEILRNAN
jgi:hypothetical protein